LRDILLRKLLPILALTFCALLLFSSRPASAIDPLFPSDNDVLEYKLLVDATAVYGMGPFSYGIEMDMTHTIQNSSGDLYWANTTMTPVAPVELFGPYIGETEWDTMLHHYGEIPHVHLVSDSDWSDFDYGWMTNLFFIPSPTEPGDNIYIGQTFSYNDNSSYYYASFPVLPGPSITVGANQLDTVKIGLSSVYHVNWTHLYNYPYYTVLDLNTDIEILWEWSLGFLTQINFEFYYNEYAHYGWQMSELFVKGNLTLVDYSLAATPLAYTGGAAAAAAASAAAMGMMIAVAAVIIIIVVIIIIFLIWRSRKAK
jgi:hypothetical protein